MGSKYRNHNTRTEALRQLAQPGDSILLVPYNEGAFQQESSSLKAASIKQGMKVELKSVLVVVEGELPQRFLRVTRV
ncbi:MAG: hypothetical protein LBE93_13035 [Enterobacter asburiae]|nr:hypothetical protein [Enterobacter asburiae]